VLARGRHVFSERIADGKSLSEGHDNGAGMAIDHNVKETDGSEAGEVYEVEMEHWGHWWRMRGYCMGRNRSFDRPEGTR